MPNTVNNVMNVIANPDYGIKNIAGTNKEILAILQGTHNSENNIYNIVDDVRNLLQKLVDANPKKKTDYLLLQKYKIQEFLFVDNEF